MFKVIRRDIMTLVSLKKAFSVGILYAVSIVMVIILVACEDRAGDEPRMVISVQNNELYGAGIDCNLNYTEITFILDGNPGFIRDAKILVDYDKLRGTFVGTGSPDYIVTNSDGIAVGTYLAKPTARGVTQFTAKMERFRSVEETVVLYLYDMPEIEVTAEDMIISPDELTNIFVQLTDKSDNVANKTIVFTTNRGLLAFETAVTDENGKAANVFDANGHSGSATIRATLQFCPNNFEELQITIRE